MNRPGDERSHSNRAVLASLLMTVMAQASVGCDDAADDSPSATASGSGGTGGERPFVPLPRVEGLDVLEDLHDDPNILEVSLTAHPSTAQIVPGEPTRVSTYEGRFPGPLLHARVGDRVIVHFTNALDEETTVHWHGLRISDQMDGSPRIQAPIAPGDGFTYDFVVPDAGTFWYHSHLAQIEQLERGLYGAIVVHENDAPAFSAERILVVDDIRLDADNQVAPFEASGPDVGAGRVGNRLLVNGAAVPAAITIPRGGIERWRIVLASNALEFGLRIRGADARVIATDGGLLPEPFTLDRVEMAPGQRYDLEVRPQSGATEVVLEAAIFIADETGAGTDVPFALVQAGVAEDDGRAVTAEPIYPEVAPLPRVDVAAEDVHWELSGHGEGEDVVFTLEGEEGTVGQGHDHLLLDTFFQNVPVRMTIRSDVSPSHPFHIHGQFFQVIARDGRAVFEPGLHDTVQIRGFESATILSYFDNPGRWMVHCHIAEHSERGMMQEIEVIPASRVDGSADDHAGH